MAKSFQNLKKKMSPERRRRVKKDAERRLKQAYALQELRKALDLTQEQVGLLLEMNQSAVSRLESQDDMYVSTLYRFVHALGGKLKIVASFPDKGEVRIDHFNLS